MVTPGELGRTQIICFSFCSLQSAWVQGQRGGEGPRADHVHSQSMPLCEDAVTLAFPHHRVPACSMEAILHSARSRIPSVMCVTGHQGILWATCLSLTKPPSLGTDDRMQAKQCTMPFSDKDLAPGLPTGRQACACRCFSSTLAQSSTLSHSPQCRAPAN